MTISKISTPCLSLGFFFLFMFVSFGLKAQNLNDYYYADQLYKSGQIEKSEIYYNSFIKNSPDNFYVEQALWNLGTWYLSIHNYKKAQDYLYRLKQLYIQRQDFDFNYHLCLANCIVAEYCLGEISEAKNNAEYLFDYFNDYYFGSMPQNSINNVILFYSSAAAIFGDYDRKKAYSCLSKAAFLAENYNCPNPIILANMAFYQIEEEQYSAALVNIENAFKFNPNTQLYFELSANYLTCRNMLNLDVHEFAQKISLKLQDHISQYFNFL